MPRLILFLVVSGILALVAAWLANHPGSVVIQWQGTDLRTSVGVLVAVFLAAAVALAALFELWRWVTRLPRRMSRNRQSKRSLRGHQELARGLLASASGDVAGARQARRRVDKLLPNHAATLLLSAQTAQMEGDDVLAQQKYRQMLDRPGAELLGLRGLVAEAIRQGDGGEALKLVRDAHARNPGAPWVLTSMFELQTRDGRWNDALATTADMLRYRIVDPSQAKRRRGVLQYLIAEERLERGDQTDALVQARKAVALAPDFPLAAALAGGLAGKLGRGRLARKLIEQGWRAAPHPDLAKAYDDLVERPEPPLALLDRFRRLAAVAPDHVETRMTMANLAIAAGRYDEARCLLAPVIADQPRAGAFRLMAEIERATENRPDEIAAWLQRAVDAPPDPAWVCARTGQAFAGWQPVPPGAGFDALRWTQPGRVMPLMGALAADDKPVLTSPVEPTPPPPAATAAANGAATPSAKAPTAPAAVEPFREPTTVDAVAARG